MRKILCSFLICLLLLSIAQAEIISNDSLTLNIEDVQEQLKKMISPAEGDCMGSVALEQSTPGIAPGQLVVQHKKEICMIPNPIPGDKVKISKKADELCKLDFYNDPMIAICPKDNSTNPATEIYEVPKNMTKIDFEKNECLKVESARAGKKIAKLKSSTSCSYTPSILGYNQLSKFFSGAGNVPESVVRTMNIEAHKKIAEKGLKTRIAPFWATFLSKDKQATDPKLYTTVNSEKQLYGALISNPTHEEQYKEFYGGKGFDGFKVTKVYKEITNANDLAKTVPTNFAAAAPIIQRQRDATDMMVMDYIMNQQDRFGNIHKKTYWHYMEDGEKKTKKFDAKDTKEIADMQKLGAVKVDEMLLKDNDCGVAKSNVLKTADALKGLRHIAPKTYRKTLEFAETLKKPEVQKYYKDELFFTEADLNGPNGIVKNAALAAKTLKENCEKGLLKQDLDIEIHLGFKHQADSCL